MIHSLRCLGYKKIVVTGPQRSGTRLAAKVLAEELSLGYVDEEEFNVHSIGDFVSRTSTAMPEVIQAPSMSAYCHLLPEDVPVVWMCRSLEDVLASQRRIGWEPEGPLHGGPEKDRYFTREVIPSAVVKTQAWQQFQRIQLGERAYEMDYESLRGHPLWVDADRRKAFLWNQTAIGVKPAPKPATQPQAKLAMAIAPVQPQVAAKPQTILHKHVHKIDLAEACPYPSAEVQEILARVNARPELVEKMLDLLGKLGG